MPNIEQMKVVQANGLLFVMSCAIIGSGIITNRQFFATIGGLGLGCIELFVTCRNFIYCLSHTSTKKMIRDVIPL